MKKDELAAAISTAAGITRKQAATAVDAFCDVVAKAMHDGDKVTLTGFGTFEAKKRDGRVCRNPQNGETVYVAAHKVPTFKAGKGLKDAIMKK